MVIDAPASAVDGVGPSTPDDEVPPERIAHPVGGRSEAIGRESDPPRQPVLRKPERGVPQQDLARSPDVAARGNVPTGTVTAGMKDQDRALQSADAGEVTSVRAAGVLEVLLSLAFGGGAAWTMLHLAQNGELPMTPWGFRSMAGPFEALGQQTFSILGWALVAICALDVLAGIWLVQRRRSGLGLGLVTALPQFALGLGFALPFLLVGVPIRVVLAVAGRRSLR